MKRHMSVVRLGDRSAIDFYDPICIEKRAPLGYKQELPTFSWIGKSEHYE